MIKTPLRHFATINDCYSTIFELHSKFHKDKQRNLKSELFISCYGFPKEKIKGEKPSGRMKVELVAYQEKQDVAEIEWLMENV